MKTHRQSKRTALRTQLFSPSLRCRSVGLDVGWMCSWEMRHRKAWVNLSGLLRRSAHSVLLRAFGGRRVEGFRPQTGSKSDGSCSRRPDMGYLAYTLLRGVSDRTAFSAYTTQPLILYFPLFFAGVTAISVLYGEIRFMTQSVWPAVFMHTIANAFVNPLILQGFIKIAPDAGFLVSPSPDSIRSIIIFCLIGFAVYQYRKRTATGASRSDRGIV